MSSQASGPAMLDSRHAVPLLPNTPSCGNQPAHISLTARRPLTRSPDPTRTKQAAPAPLIRDGRRTLPLDRTPLHISCGRGVRPWRSPRSAAPLRRPRPWRPA
ncbi:hypothetical protein ACFFX0_12530 [Citricoccus parietis]|uniref:Uncharacterized protein n=1 Tax=Citricoccus parietis TaxID=592307 RepID=A0ABV5FZ88_9MICC